MFSKVELELTFACIFFSKSLKDLLELSDISDTYISSTKTTPMSTTTSRLRNKKRSLNDDNKVRNTMLKMTFQL